MRPDRIAERQSGSKKPYTVAVLPGTGRNGRGVAAALHGKGFKLISFEQDRGEISRSANKRYLSRFFVEFHYYKQSFLDNPETFTNAMIELIKKTGTDVLIPTGTENTIAIAIYHARYSEYCSVATELWEKMERLHDKMKVISLAEKLNIPHPKTFCPESVQELEEIAYTLGFPLILKARRGMSSTSVYIIHNTEELKKGYAKLTANSEYAPTDGKVLDNSYPIVQEFIPEKQLHDGTAYAENGVALLVTSQARLMTYPLSMGGGIFNRTTYVDDIHEGMRKLVRATDWNGVLEADFLYDSRDAKYKLIEVNPKFWGTSYLTAAAGYNYSLYCVQRLLGEPRNLPEYYQVGLTCRWPIAEMRTWLSRPVNVLIFFHRIYSFLARFLYRPQVIEPCWKFDLRLRYRGRPIIRKVIKKFTA